MASIDEINTVNPTWQIERKKEQDAKDGKNKKFKKEPRRSQKSQKPDDGRPHIDEYA
jgi:hypothetical protein